MSARPLTREEQDFMLSGEYDLTSCVAALAAIARWKATVQAAEELAEQMRAALEALMGRTEGYVTERSAWSIAKQALAAHDAARGEA